jgi:16S rRNA (cytosine1402-N4)-methyltransferase
MTEAVHTPVLLEETVRYLAPRKGGEVMVDATMGEGGHSLAFLARFPDLEIVGVDADGEIQELARERLKRFGGRARFYPRWSQDFFASYPGDLPRPDTILMDLGVSLYHYEKSGRGFSFRKNEPLDMRIDRTRGVNAAELVARLPEKELADILYLNAGERYSRRIARSIAAARSRGTITGSAALAEIVRAALPPSRRYGRPHPATRVFQALRIAVNGELAALPELLGSALKVLLPGGRMGVISFHSLEDRIVKNFFRVQSGRFSRPPEEPIGKRGDGIVKILTPKGISPEYDEIRQNPPSRSARLRVIEKLTDEEE